MLLKDYSREIFKVFEFDGAREGFGTLKDVSVQWIHSFSGMATLTVAGCAAMVAAYKALDKQFNLTFDTAVLNSEEHLSNIESAKSEIGDLQSQAEEYKDTLSSMAESYNIDVTGIDTISELIDKIRSASDVKLSLTDESQLSQIERENAALERQIELKNSIITSEQKKAADDAKAALTRNVESTVPKYAPLTSDNKYKSNKNIIGGSIAKSYIGIEENISNITTAIQDYEKEIELLKEKQRDLDPDSKKYAEAQSDIDKYKESIQNLKNELNTNGIDLETLLSSLSVDGEGVTALKGYEKEFDIVKKLIDEINNYDLSPIDRDLKSIQSFFDSSRHNFLKDELIEIAKSGEITEETLAEMGITLEQVGVSGSEGLSNLNRYFKELTGSANEATDVIEGFDGSLKSITDAGDSENEDKNWNTVSELFKKAKELNKSKKWGTDDFQSMAQFITPEGELINTKNSDLKAVDYKNLWDKYYSNFKKYFDEDNPLQSAINAQKKLISSGLGTKDSNGIIKWTENFKSSADAAEAWGISVEAAEIAMHNLESYGAEFDGVRFDNEELNEYKSSLEGLRKIYESLEDGSEKDRLGVLIAGWDEEYAKYEQDMSTFDENQIVKITFEYDLAELQRQIQDARDMAESSDTNEDWANVVSGQKKERTTLESKTGYTKDVDVNYAESYEKLNELRSQRNKASEEDKIYFTKQMSAIGDLQNSFQQFRLDGGTLDWKDFLKSDQATATLQDIMDSTQLTEDQISELFGLKPEDMKFEIEADTANAENKIKGILDNDGKTIIMDVEASTEQINAQLSSLEEGQTIVFQANVNGVDSAIKAVKDENGKIVYTADVNGVDVPGDIIEQDGEIVFLPNTDAVDEETAKTDGGTRWVKYLADLFGLPTTFSTLTRKVNYVATGAVSGAISSIAKNAVNSFYSGGTVTPAFASGTAYNVINYRPIANAFAKGQIALPKDEVAVVNELGQEGLIRDGKLMVIPGGIHMQALKKGDIVLSVDQMKALFSSGHAPGHARAYATGTILSSAYGNGMLSLGGSSTKSSSSKKKSSNSKSSKSSSDSDKTEEELNWIEILISRVERSIKNLGKTVSATYKTWSSRNDALYQEISKVNEEISWQEKAYNRYMQAANSVGLNSTYQELVKNGKIDIETITDTDLVDKIKKFQDYYEAALDCQDAIQDLQDDLADLARTRFDNVEQEYEDRLSVIEHQINMLEGSIDLMEERGYLLSTSYYDSLMKVEKDNINQLTKEYESLSSALAEAMRIGQIAEYSEEWYDMQNAIFDVKEEILDANKALVEYQNSLRELKWDLFDRSQDMLSQIQDESNFFIDLMGNSKMFNDNASITEQGRATLGLHAVNYNAYMSQADDYAKELLAINKEITNDPYNTTLLDRRQELLESQHEMIKNAEDEKQAIKDLVEEGYDAFLDAMEKIIDKRKDLLNATKDLYDYEQNVADITKEITSLQKQLLAYQGDTSEESRATIQKIKVDLEDKQKDLRETEYERYISDQEQMLDNLFDDTQEWVNNRLDNLELVIQEVIDATNENAGAILSTLEGQAEDVGIALSDELKAIFEPNGTYTSVVSMYGDNFSSYLTTTNNTLNKIREYLAKMAGESDQEANEQIKNIEESVITTPPPSSSPSTSTSNTNTSNSASSNSSWGSWFKKQVYTGNKSKLNINTSIVDRLKYRDFASDFSSRSSYYKSMGGSGTYTGSSKQNQWMIATMKSHGFKKGGTIGGLIKSAGEDGFVLAREGEHIFTPEQLKELQKTFTLMSPLLNSMKELQKQITDDAPIMKNNMGNITIDVGDIQMYGVNDPQQFAEQLGHALKNDTNIKKIIQSDTIGLMMGKNSLNKFKY